MVQKSALPPLILTPLISYGIGTGFSADGTPYPSGSESRITNEIATGKSMDLRAEFMMSNLEKQLANGDNEVNTFGFSRGAASQVDFLNRIQDKIDDGDPFYSNIEINYTAAIDAVASKRTALLTESNANHSGRKVNTRGRVTYQKPDFRFDLPKNMNFKNTPLHIVGIDERRKQFQGLDLQ